MSHYKVLIQRLSSPDGKSIAEAKSVVITSGDNESTTSQAVTVKISSGNSCTSSSRSSVSTSKVG